VRILPSFRMMAVILCLSGAATVTAACGKSAVSEGGGPCGLVVDATSFFAHTDVRDKIQSYVPRFLDGCATVGFGVVTGNSGATDCRRPLMRLNPTSADNPQGNPKTAEGIRAARRKAAVATLWQLAECGHKEEHTHTGSDILGALDLIARSSAEYGRPSKILLISDMIEKTDRLNLYRADIGTPAKRTRILRGLRSERALPPLSGSKISIMGLGLLDPGGPDRLTDLREFWNEVLAASDAPPPVTYL
jgi:hypothetical protein